MRGNYTPLKGTNLTVVARIHPFLPGIVYYSSRFDVINSFIICYCTWIARYNISIDRYNHVITMILTCRCGALTSLIIGKRYTLQNTTGEVMWSCNVTTIEHEGEKCKSSVLRKERLVYPRSLTLRR